jgi:hypothetical protein
MTCCAAARLACICLAFNLSVAGFAQRMSLPLRRAKRILKPDRKPSLKLLNRVHLAFPEISLPWLFCGEGTMVPLLALPAPVAPIEPSNCVGTNYGTLYQTITYGSDPPAAH